MRTTARVNNAAGHHRVSVLTEGHEQPVAIPAKAAGRGSAVNGGELLCLALATCYCNDVFREATRTGVAVDSVSVEVEAEFGQPGEPARSISYRVRLAGEADAAALRGLALHVDAVAEVQATLRRGMPVVLAEIEVERS